MAKLFAFNFLTLNGFFKGTNEDISWHRHEKEQNEFAAENLQAAGNILLFGRVTYEMMAGYWPTPAAMEHDPFMAERMNTARKIVFSKTLKSANWNNTTLMKDNIEEEVLLLKKQDKDMAILGSGTIITQFAEQGLIDEYHIMIDPVAIGKGTCMFQNINQKLQLELVSTRTFKSGAVLLCYRPLVR